MSAQSPVLVTGAAGGIGAATVAALLQRGYRVYAGVHHAGQRLAGDARTITLDVTDTGSVAAAAEEIARDEPGGLRAVVNNAGVIVQGPLELVPETELHRQFAVNVYGPAAVTRALLPSLRTGNGRVINISAPTARIPIPFMGPIGASKAALESLSESLRAELAPWGIPVVTVVPGLVETEIFAKAAASAAAVPADPALTALYAKRLAAMARSAERQKASPPEVVAATIVRAVEAARPKDRYAATRDVRMFDVLSHLPTGLRRRAISSALGLTKAERG